MNNIDKEKKVVEYMIRIYCKKNEHNISLCNECTELLDYAHKRLDNCKFKNNKPTCKQCPVHCYKKDMRERMCKVMRFSGPRIIFYHPIAAIRHLIKELHFSPKTRIKH